MRAHFEPKFSHLASLDMANTFEMEIEGWADMLSKSHALREKEVTLGSFQRDATEACRYLPFRLTGLTVYGEALDDETYQDLVHLNDLHEEVMLDAFFGKLTVSNIYNILPTQSKRRLDTFKSKWEKLNLDIVAKARTNNFHCPAERIYKGVESGKMSKVEFLETMDELLFTNIDVTSTVLAFLLINIAANQTFQSLLRDEIAAKQSQPSYNLSDYVLEKNSLLHYAAMESVRMSPALWFSLPEKTAAKKVIGGYLIPAKTPVVIDWKRLNTTPAIWGSDGEQFRPERFADISPTAYRYGLLRFGMGRGRCLGKNIADMMLKMAAVAIVQRFSMVPAGKEKGTRQDRFTVTSEQEIEFTPLSQTK
ncbi:Cytochrome P450 CYP5293A1 [Beauveria bassiana ARSEF 2860]|uniref:Cytochrome P450 CYP5293A1 n=1 Tax=Beauveria bassiana (strain ARSEF 2860) TaxID=655819 RepID=J4W2F5_BEAB2|nr:Cytochrome P450 CYP5293A1 [Beauveria bassiana ARSEF 2860]EJP64645.1 Cytochrome P450 CYP5293A1 [Beauveria bassiana ARSEF 2860]